MNDKPTFELYEYLPFYLRSIANRLNMIDARLYSKELGVGLNEWSCLALLAREDDISATRICEVSGFDKAVISRSVRALIEKGYVSATPVPNHNRKQLLKLTKDGRAIYSRIESLVMKREQVLLDGISPEDRKKLIGLLSQILEASDTLLSDGMDALGKA